MTPSARSRATRRPGKVAPGAEANSAGEAAKGRGESTLRGNPPTQIGSPQWRDMVAAAAYYRAEARGFCGGSPDQDWLDAEAELRQRLAPDAGQPAPIPHKPMAKKSGKNTQ